MLKCNPYTDQELIALLKENERNAIEQIYERYWKSLYLSAYSLIKDAAQSEDIVQDVLLQLWLKKDMVEILSLKAYLFTAVRYKVLSYIRSAGNRKVFIGTDEMEKLAGKVDIRDRLNENDINDILEIGISSLPERCREIFILSRKQHLSNKEIATKMGISIKTVENQMTIALRLLRKELGEFLFWACIVLPLFYN